MHFWNEYIGLDLKWGIPPSFQDSEEHEHQLGERKSASQLLILGIQEKHQGTNSYWEERRSEEECIKSDYFSYSDLGVFFFCIMISLH